MKKFLGNIMPFLIGFLIVLGLTDITMDNSLSDEDAKEISYNKFLTMVESDKVEKIVINYNSSTFQVIDNQEVTYITDNPRTENFKEFLLKEDIKVEELMNSEGNSFGSVFIFIGLMVLFIFLSKKMMPNVKGNFKVKNSANIKDSKKGKAIPKVRFDDIAGQETVKRDVKYLVDFLKNPKKYTEMGARMSKGAILYGPPGTGKTLIAKAIAGEAGVPFISVSGSDFVEMFVGVGAKRVRELFDIARKQAPCIIFIDEMDAVGRKRGEPNSSERDQTINALLTQLDGFNSGEGIVVIGATNQLETLDEALIRPGRFDKHIAVPNPDYKERKAILNLHAKNKRFEEDVDFDSLAKLTIGFSGAGLETLLNESAIIAVSEGKSKIDKNDVDNAFYKVIMKGDKKSTKDIDEKQLELVAWHEAGHALVSKLLTNKSIPKVTIVPSTNGAGGVTFIIPDKPGLHTKKDLKNEIKTLYAGRIAEFLLTGNEELITTGASQDIKQATNIILGMVKSYGMSKEFGMLYVEGLSAFTDNEVLRVSKELSDKLYQETLELMRYNKLKLEAIALELLEKETINEEDLDNVLNK